ncbi:hypothetical protein L596_025253 [Steinernema carpocapsae]|uniref:Uncharacterized protein n=1 Tax=Steinernema carpocapsae TaxID=34508 RepID=A0A4U5M792_STECR|nr:hypothetical protein L596_025253 [Steinernema carpocapsae]
MVKRCGQKRDNQRRLHSLQKHKSTTKRGKITHAETDRPLLRSGFLRRSQHIVTIDAKQRIPGSRNSEKTRISMIRTKKGDSQRLESRRQKKQQEETDPTIFAWDARSSCIYELKHRNSTKRSALQQISKF